MASLTALEKVSSLGNHGYLGCQQKLHIFGGTVSKRLSPQPCSSGIVMVSVCLYSFGMTDQFSVVVLRAKLLPLGNVRQQAIGQPRQSFLACTLPCPQIDNAAVQR